MSDRINLSPNHWGPKTWFFLESAAIAYPTNPTDEEKTSAKNLILALRDLLPCELCRINYRSYLNEIIQGNYLDNVVKDRDSFMNFIILVHNDVRVKTDKPSRSVEEVFNYYEKQYSSTPVNNYETFANTTKLLSKEEIMKNLDITKHNNVTEGFSSPASEMLFHFNPITLLIGFMIGLIAFKFYSDTVKCEK